MWEKLDNYSFKDNEKFCCPTKTFGCDGVNHSDNSIFLSLPFYHLDNKDHGGNSIDLCQKCFDGDNVLQNIFSIDTIDREKVSVVVKPLDWSCFLCSKKLGGGHKWYVYNYNHVRSSLDICRTCHQILKNSSFDELKRRFSKVTKNIICCMRGSALIDISPVKYRIVPKCINIDEGKIDHWIKLLCEIVHIPPIENFGSVRQWALFTDFYSVPNIDAETSLLIDCSQKTCGRIASAVMDSHGRIAIDIIYSSVNDYLIEYEKWEKNRKKYVKSDHSEDEDESKPEMCEEFSGYIRLKLGLNMYYG